MAPSVAAPDNPRVAVAAPAYRGLNLPLFTMNEKATEAFRILAGFEPMRWQQRLLEMLLRGEVPTAVALPTGLGKTSVMALWLIARAFGAPLPRRLVYVVDRRVVVDQASTEARKLRCRLAEPSVQPVLQRLREGLGLGDAAKLVVSTLRGGLMDDAAWRVDPAAAAIIVGTVDMIGSRLLFEGYGVSRRMRPLQAGLLGCDTLLVLDEAHLVPPFAALLRSIAEDASLHGSTPEGLVPGLRLMTLSATGGEVSDTAVFGLEVEDAKEELVKHRLRAVKRLCVTEAVPRKDLPGRLAKQAKSLAGSAEKAARVIVFCDRRTDAQQVVEQLNAQASGPAVHLLVGERRGHERARATAELEKEGFLAGSPRPERPAVLVATAAGEVGADLDADHMVGDVVAFERMVQRLGRVNRRGGDDRAAKVVLIPVAPEARPDCEQAAREARGAKALQLLQHLPRNGDTFDVSPGALDELQCDPTLAGSRAEATTPAPLRPALTRALIEAWSLTGLAEHTGRPEIAPWLRGWVEEPPEARLFWRRFLPWRGDERRPVAHEVAEFFEHASPAPVEIVEAPVWRAVEVLKTRGRTLLGSEEPPETPAALVLTPALELERALTLGDLGRLDPKNDLAKLAGRLVALSSVLGGLTDDGLLDGTVEGVAPDGPSAAKGIGCTADAPEGMKGVPLRFTAGSPDAAAPPEEGWVEAHAWPLKLDMEGAPERMLRIWTPEHAKADPALARRAQTLADHAAAVEKEVIAITERLGLPEAYRDVLRLAARLHDAGKAAPRWQDAFSAPKEGGPYAKTAARRVDQRLLGHYRHEFGSLADAMRDPALCHLPADLRDLALHLIAAHHGRARPVIGTDGAPMMPTRAEELARETALRFARLQHRWGPWGLAWWEALLRLADAAASAKQETA